MPSQPGLESSQLHSNPKVFLVNSLPNAIKIKYFLPGLLLSAAVSPSKKIMDVGYNVAEISKVQHKLRNLSVVKFT